MKREKVAGSDPALRFGKDVTRSEVLAARDALFAHLQQFKQDADADLAACLQQELAGATTRYQLRNLWTKQIGESRDGNGHLTYWASAQNQGSNAVAFQWRGGGF